DDVDPGEGIGERFGVGNVEAQRRCLGTEVGSQLRSARRIPVGHENLVDLVGPGENSARVGAHLTSAAGHEDPLVPTVYRSGWHTSIVDRDMAVTPVCCVHYAHLGE